VVAQETGYCTCSTRSDRTAVSDPGPANGPPGPSLLLIIATLFFIVGTFGALMGFSGAHHPHAPWYRGLFWLCWSAALVMAYWDHEHRRFK
jgi:hypothetical protein